MTSYNQSKVSPRKEGKRAYSQNMVCNHENTLTSKGGFKVVPFIHEKPKLPLLLPSSITFIKTLKMFIFLSSLFEVLIIPRTGSIFFLVQTLHLCTGRIQNEELKNVVELGKNIFGALCQLQFSLITLYSCIAFYYQATFWLDLISSGYSTWDFVL